MRRYRAAWLTLPGATQHVQRQDSGARRCAAQWLTGPDQERQAGRRWLTVNDAVLAMCQIALLPPDGMRCGQTADRDEPVSLRSKEDAPAAAWSASAMQSPPIDDPAQRIQTISASRGRQQEDNSELPQLRVLALSALNMAPLTLAGVPGFLSAVPPPSTSSSRMCRGPVDPLYPALARPDSSYPLSNIPDGQALNITLSEIQESRLRTGRVPSQCAGGCLRTWNRRCLEQAVRDPKEPVLMPKLSAGVLLYRARAGVVDVLLAHPGGPFGAGKDDSAWSIPKGEYTGGEDRGWPPARNSPEIGLCVPDRPRIDFGSLKQSGGKVVTVFGVRADLSITDARSSTFGLAEGGLGQDA